MSDTERFDALLMNMAQTQRGIEPLLETVFSFLRRKTDFFSGATPAVVEETVLNAVRKQAALAEKDQYAKKQEEEAKRKQREQKKRAEEEANRKAAEAEAKRKAPEPEPTPRFQEVTDEQAEAITKTAVSSEKGGAVEHTDEDAPPPVGNGGRTDKYVWTQTLQEAQANFSVPDGTKSRQVHVEITASCLKVGLKGAPPMVDGLLFKRVKVDDSFWTLEDGNRICVYLQKENQMEWWKTIIQGDEEIDTQKVQPENSQLSDLDADTRQTVEKMMFDQRQKALGLPSSDDLQKQEVLQKFMKQHPEMDFSNAKIN